MGRVAAGLLASGMLLFASGAVGLVAPWALVAGVGLLTTGGIAFAIVAEARDLRPLTIAPAPTIADAILDPS